METVSPWPELGTRAPNRPLPEGARGVGAGKEDPPRGEPWVGPAGRQALIAVGEGGVQRAEDAAAAEAQQAPLDHLALFQDARRWLGEGQLATIWLDQDRYRRAGSPARPGQDTQVGAMLALPDQPVSQLGSPFGLNGARCDARRTGNGGSRTIHCGARRRSVAADIYRRGDEGNRRAADEEPGGVDRRRVSAPQGPDRILSE